MWVLFFSCLIASFVGGIIANHLVDLWAQWDDNKFRRAVGLETKPLRIRRIL